MQTIIVHTDRGSFVVTEHYTRKGIVVISRTFTQHEERN